jgi:hypothetical protein
MRRFLFFVLLPLPGLAVNAVATDDPVVPDDEADAPPAAVAPAASPGSAPEADENIYDPLYGAPKPLAAAFRAFGRDANRWAYTQHLVVYNGKGKVQDEQVVRYDPSQHYDVQWTMLSKNGEPATESQIKKHRRQMAKRTKDRRSLGELLLLKQASLARETESELVYEVPFAPDEKIPFSPDKFQIYVTVDRATQTLRSLDVKLRESVRFAAVVKVKSGEARLTFARVLPEHGPAITGLVVAGSGSVLFVPLSSRSEAKRSDFKRVTPYDDRFTVKPGPLKMIDF